MDTKISRSENMVDVKVTSIFTALVPLAATETMIAPGGGVHFPADWMKDYCKQKSGLMKGCMLV